MTRKTLLPGAALLATFALVAPTLAQAPGGFGQGGQGGQGGFGRNGGGRGGFGRPMTGSVTAVDATAGTVTLAAVGGAQPQTIKVGADTPIAAETAGTTADLKVGDPVQVTGGPLDLTITTGTLPASFGAMGRFLTGGGGRGGFGGNVTDPTAASYSITNGTVTSVSPLTISAGNNVSITLKSTDNAKVSHITTGTLAGIKTGDQILATGQTDATGTVTATMVAVNFPQMQGGFGQGGRGGFGQGGRGGFGQGGQGGQGRRRNNAGAFGNGGANAQVVPQGEAQ